MFEKLPVPTKEELIAAILSTGTQYKAAKHFGVGEATMTKWLRIVGVRRGDYPPQRKPVSSRRPSKEVMVQLLADLGNFSAVADHLNASRDTVRIWAKFHGIFTPTGFRRPSTRLTDEDRELIRALHPDLSIRVLAEKFECCRATIRLVVRCTG